MTGQGARAETYFRGMLSSMTGFGRAEGQVNDRKVSVEVRSLNSKQLDLLVKVPSAFREMEVDLRQWVAERAVRGKVEMYVNSEPAPGTRRAPIDAAAARLIYEELRTVALAIDPEVRTDLMGLVLRMPEVAATAREVATDDDRAAVMTLIGQAMQAFVAFRTNEGRKLQHDLNERLEHIKALLAEVDALDKGRAERTRERLRSRLAELQAAVDAERFEQELVFYLEKMDMNEEKVRLRAHLGHFTETMEKEQQQGRKLGFIAQEMGREINTLGSKANDAAIQRCVVLMKDELEKIKEQVLNVL